MKTWQNLKRNPKLWSRYFMREKVIKAIRAFFDRRGFHEIETPLLIAHPAAESYLEVFETALLDRNRKAHKAYLSTSPEVALKKLMVAGLGNCYSITKSFRNMETGDRLHNPEFTILEWYRVGVYPERPQGQFGASYTDIMTDCEELLLSIHSVIPGLTRNLAVKNEIPAFAGMTKAGSRLPASRRGAGSGPDDNTINYRGQRIDLTPPWERVSIEEAFARWAHINLDHFFKLETAKKIAAIKGYTVELHTTWEELFHQIFLNEVEPHLGCAKPTILYDFPAQMGALAKKKAADPRFAERFEFYIAGLELGDCYSELTDWREQEERFKKEIMEIRRLGKTEYEYDKDFIEALKKGLPQCSGIAVGVDRLIMLFADVTDIADTMFFPAEKEFELGDKREAIRDKQKR